VNHTGERLKRATQLWHGYLAATGQRFDLAKFLKDPSLEKQVIAKALAHGDQKLAALAHEWLIGTNHPMVSVSPPRTAQPGEPAAAGSEAAKPARYLKGVR